MSGAVRRLRNSWRSGKELQIERAEDFESWKKRLFASKAALERLKIRKNDTTIQLKRKLQDKNREERVKKAGAELSRRRSESSSGDTIAQGRLNKAFKNETIRLGTTYWEQREARERRKREKKRQNDGENAI